MADKTGHNPSTIRKHNKNTVLDIIRKNQSCTAAEITRQLSLSKTTVRKIIDKLLEEGLIKSIGVDTTLEERGKRPERYSLNREFGYVIGVTIFSNNILAALCNSGGTIFYKEKQPIRPNASLDEIIPLISDFIDHWQSPDGDTVPDKSRLLGIVIASTGVTDSDEGICYTAAEFPSWPSEAPIKALIERRVTLKAPLYIDNYNRYSAFAEKHLGGLNKYQNLVNIITAEDGLGSGIIIDGKLRRGSHHLSGEIGHMKVNAASEDICHCGGRGCLERMVAVKKMINMALDGKKDHPESSLYNSDKTPSISSLFTAADEGDLWSRRILDETIYWLAIGIQNITLLFDPEVIVISGIYNQGCNYFLQKLKDETEHISLNRMKKDLDIRYSRLGEEAPLLGAVHYVIEDYFSL